MKGFEHDFPSVESLWTGCVLGSIAHAAAMVKFPELAHEQSWDNMNYSVQDSAGTRGTISFSPEMVFGAFRDERSPRLEAHGDPSFYLEGAPEPIVAFAQREALQYLLDRIDGVTVPVVTAAFWSVHGRVVARDSWPHVVEHGAHILRRQLLPLELAMEAWAEEYEFGSSFMDLIKQLFIARTLQPAGLIVMSADCSTELVRQAESTAGIEEAKTSFREMGILWPDGDS